MPLHKRLRHDWPGNQREFVDLSNAILMACWDDAAPPHLVRLRLAAVATCSDAYRLAPRCPRKACRRAGVCRPVAQSADSPDCPAAHAAGAYVDDMVDACLVFLYRAARERVVTAPPLPEDAWHY